MREYDIPIEWENLIKNKELARVVGDITGDGHLQLSGRRGIASFYSKHMEEIKRENNRFMKLFGIKGHVYTDNRKTVRYKLMIPSKRLAIFLESIGVPVGNKTNKEFSVPDWILKGCEEIKSSYLRGIFTSEACISLTKKRWRIHIEQYKSVKLEKAGIQFMLHICQMLKDFGIITSPIRTGKGNIRRDGTKSIRMQLDIEKRYFNKFYKYIGFDNKVKNEKLRIAMRENKRGLEHNLL